MAEDAKVISKGAVIVGVDDDPINLRLLKAVVEDMGYAFMGVDSGDACLHLLQRVMPRVILMDIMMPEMDGMEACRRIRAEFPTRNPRIIIVSALGSPEDVTRALDCGANDFVVKPIDPAQLRKRITHWMRDSR